MKCKTVGTYRQDKKNMRASQMTSCPESLMGTRCQIRCISDRNCEMLAPAGCISYPSSKPARRNQHNGRLKSQIMRDLHLSGLVSRQRQDGIRFVNCKLRQWHYRPTIKSLAGTACSILRWKSFASSNFLQNCMHFSKHYPLHSEIQNIRSLGFLTVKYINYVRIRYIIWFTLIQNIIR